MQDETETTVCMVNLIIFLLALVLLYLPYNVYLGDNFHVIKAAGS
jgi:hypothetical protein